jgi:hypothetical protein
MSVRGPRVADHVFLTKNGRPKLVRCAVLFVDLLGVREMNRSRRVASHLVGLERAVSRAYRDFLEPNSPWPGAFFSDTLVLASPVLPHGGEEAAIGGLVLQAAWLQLQLITEGFFVRGGLSIGRFHIRDGFVFGPALAEAYEIESRAAIHPRIVLSSEAERSQHADLRFYAEPAYSPQSLMLMRDADGHTFINYLGVLFDEPEDPEPSLAWHRDTVIARLREHRGNRRLWEKYRWLAEYHNDVVSRAFPKGPALLVPALDMTWQFASFA